MNELLYGALASLYSHWVILANNLFYRLACHSSSIMASWAYGVIRCCYWFYYRLVRQLSWCCRNCRIASLNNTFFSCRCWNNSVAYKNRCGDWWNSGGNTCVQGELPDLWCLYRDGISSCFGTNDSGDTYPYSAKNLRLHGTNTTWLSIKEIFRDSVKLLSRLSTSGASML